MSAQGMNMVVLGLSITSSWGNGHATTYRGLLRELDALGHRVTFLERDVPWYADQRDLPDPGYCRLRLYRDLPDLQKRFGETVAAADVVIVGSYVPEGVAVGDWVQQQARGTVAFYDIDTPVTLAKLRAGDEAYLAARQIPGYHLYLSFTGGPTLGELERTWGAPRARALYCAFDPALYFPETLPPRWSLGYLGTYSEDRQPKVESLLLQPARQLPAQRFTLAGPMYPPELDWPFNLERREHVPPGAHRHYYSAQHFTLNVTRQDMVRAGWSPSVRLFEAAACGVPIISDRWAGIESLFRPGQEILLADDTEQVVDYLQNMDVAQARAIGRRAHERVMAEHTAAHRAGELVEALQHLTRTRPVVA